MQASLCARCSVRCNPSSFATCPQAGGLQIPHRSRIANPAERIVALFSRTITFFLDSFLFFTINHYFCAEVCPSYGRGHSSLTYGKRTRLSYSFLVNLDNLQWLKKNLKTLRVGCIGLSLCSHYTPMCEQGFLRYLQSKAVESLQERVILKYAHIFCAHFSGDDFNI